MAVFGRQVCDILLVLPGHYNPHKTWREREREIYYIKYFGKYFPFLQLMIKRMEN